MVKTPCLHRRGKGFHPWSGTKISHAVQCRQRKRRKTPASTALRRDAPWRLKNQLGMDSEVSRDRGQGASEGRKQRPVCEQVLGKSGLPCDWAWPEQRPWPRQHVGKERSCPQAMESGAPRTGQKGRPTWKEATLHLSLSNRCMHAC